METNYEEQLTQQHRKTVNADLIDGMTTYDIYKVKEKRRNTNGMPPSGRIISGLVEVHGNTDACWMFVLRGWTSFRSSMILNVTKSHDVVTVETANSVYELWPYKEVSE